MRRAAIYTQVRPGHSLPRGWIILGAALASWLVVALMWTGMSQVFTLVSAVI